MRITKSRLKEIIRQAMDEINFKDQAAFKKYNAKHKMRKSTKVRIGGKDTTAGKADSMSKGDVGGPAHANVPKKKDVSQQMTDKEKKKNISKKDKDSLGKLSKMMGKEKHKKKPTGYMDKDGNYHHIGGDKLTSLKKGTADDTKAKYKKVEQNRTDAIETIKDRDPNDMTEEDMQSFHDKVKSYADWMGHDEYDEVEEMQELIDDGDYETAFEVAEELLDPDRKEKEMGKNLAQMDYEDEDSPESYYDDEEDDSDTEADMMKASDDANLKMQKDVTDSAAKDLGWKDAEDLVMFGETGDISDLFDHDDIWEDLPEDLHHPINTYLDRLRDNEQGMRSDDDDLLDNDRKQLLGILQDPKGWGKKNESVREGGPGSGPSGNGDDEDNPFDREPSDDELADIEKQYEGKTNITASRLKQIIKEEVERYKLKEAPRIGTFAKSGKDETIFDVAHRVLKNKSMENYKSARGKVKLDIQTANLLVKVFKKVNPKMKKILSKLGYDNPAQLVQTLWAVVK